jgi:hypothetical protein
VRSKLAGGTTAAIVRVRRFAGLAALAALGILLLGAAASANAATLKAKYTLQGSLASDVAGAPDLVDLGTGNRFAREPVDGVERQVLTFPRGGGLSLATAGLVDSSAHSVVMTFRLDRRPGYRRLLDFKRGTSDNGLYDLNGRAVLYLDGHLAISQSPVIGSSYVQVVLTSEAAPGGLRESVYVNGAPVASGTAPKDFGLASGTLRFFKDNVSGGAGDEEAAGAVACIVVYDGILSADEVQQVAGDASLCPAPTQAAEHPQATVATKPRAQRQGRSIVVDTGLRVSCPIGTTPCTANGRLAVAQRPRRGADKGLGTAEIVVPAGETRPVAIPLSRQGAERLRKGRRLRIDASARIVTAGGEAAEANRTGTIAAPRRALRLRLYSGTTSQGLPVFLTAVGNRILNVLFRWRATCADGRVHTAMTTLTDTRVRHGRFLIDKTLRNRGSARMSGTIDGSVASGSLSRRGPTSFKTTCAVKGVTWRARSAPIEVERR